MSVVYPVQAQGLGSLNPAKEYWYRVYDGTMDGCIDIIAFEVEKHTNSGVWLKSNRFIVEYGDRKWVSKFARKRFAYPTIDEAKASYKIRKQKQIEHCEWYIDRVKQGIASVEKNEFYLYV